MVAVINFFGYVDFEKTSHQIRGLNVVVRLRKECPIMWPRLLLSAEKCNWLTNNVDAVKDEPLYEQAMHQFGKKIFRKLCVDILKDRITFHLSPSQIYRHIRQHRRYRRTFASSTV